MSWGNSDCNKIFAPISEYGGCEYATFKTCNILCPYFKKEQSLTKTQKRLLEKNNSTLDKKEDIQ